MEKEKEDNMNQIITDYIASKDPRYVQHTTDGAIILDHGTSNGGREVLARDAYWSMADPGPDDVFFAVCDTSIAAVSGRELVSTTEMTDVLLDLRRLFSDFVAKQSLTSGN